MNLAIYQQVLRTAERIKTLRREIDDVSREIHERLDDLDIILEEIPSDSLQGDQRTWVGEVKAPGEASASEKAAQEFKTEVGRLFAVARR